MWILTRESFLSIVRDRGASDRLLVRGRIAEDISRLWPDADIIGTPEADYGFRSSIPESRVIEAITEELKAITYTTDFKGGVRDRSRHDAYLAVWTALRQLRLRPDR